MQELFIKLTHALEETAFIALCASFVWGILSVLLSPCHLTSIPLIVGFINNQKTDLTVKRAFYLSLMFSIGIFITIILIGIITASMGRIMGDIGKFGNYFVAGILFVVGLYLLEIINIDWDFKGRFLKKGSGLLSALVLGLIFGAAVGPCTFAYMAPILAITFRVANTNLLYAISLVLLFSIGHCSVIVAAGTSTEIVQKYLNWNEKTNILTIIKKICGGLVIIGSVYLAYRSL